MDLNNVVSNLQKRGFKAFYAKNSSVAVDIVKKIIPTDASVGFGGSQTVTQLKLPEMLSVRGNKVIHRALLKDVNPSLVMREAVFADYFIASANAVTEDGELVNIDGTGNRVASLIFGGANSLVLVGSNKIVKDIGAAIERARKVAARLNCVRFNKDNPCVSGGDCKNCSADKTICKVTTIQHYPNTPKTYYVIIIDEALGY